MTGLSRASLHPDPFKQFERWFAEARETGMALPEAVALATADGAGRPSARIVLLRGHDDQGFVFFSNYDSRKGRDLAANPASALLFYWEPLRRQVRIEGSVSRVSSAESDGYFRTRPQGHQLSAWTSPQSDPVPARAWLERRYEEFRQKYQDQEIPRPPGWGGYRLAPTRFEFWENRDDRLHDRLRYDRNPQGSWSLNRLAP